MNGNGAYEEGRVNIGAFVTPSVRRAVREIAYKRDVTASDVIREAIRREIERDAEGAA